MARSEPKQSVKNRVCQKAAERALLDAVTVRDTVFALGDDDLVFLADALLHAIARAAHRARHAEPRHAEPWLAAA